MQPEVRLPANGGRGPGQAGSEGHENDMVTRAEPASPVCLVQRDGAGRGRGVAVFVEVHENPFLGNIDALGNGLDDAEVGLVGNEELDVVWLEAGAFNNRISGIPHAGDGVLEDILADHGEGGEAPIGILDGDGTGGAASGNVEEVGLS